MFNFEEESGPVSRVLSRHYVIYAIPGWPSLWDSPYDEPLATYPATLSVVKQKSSGTTLEIALFGLAPDGVCPAIPVAGNAVSSYLAVSPLP